MEPYYGFYGLNGYQYPPYFRAPSLCGECYIYRGSSAHVFLGEQVDEYSAIVIDGDHLLDAVFFDDTNTVVVPEEAIPKPFTEAQAATWNRLHKLQLAVAELLSAS